MYNISLTLRHFPVLYLFRQDFCRKWSTAGCECAEFVFLWKSCWTHRRIASGFAKLLQHTKGSFWLTIKNVLLNMNSEILNFHKWRKAYAQMKHKAGKKLSMRPKVHFPKDTQHFLLVKFTCYVMMPLMWQEGACDLFLSVQLISIMSSAIFAINTLSIHRENVCKSSDVIYKKPHKSSITVNKTKIPFGVLATWQLFMTQDVPSAHASCLKTLLGCDLWICLHFFITSVWDSWV